MKISYAISVCNEIEEIKRLIPFLLEHKREEDEIVVLLDKPKASQELLDTLYVWSSKDYITLKESTFQNNFANWKNELNRICIGDFIFNIDADEIPNEILIHSLPEILENNDFDICMVPRVNTVEGIGLHSLNKWGWSVSKLESQIREKELDLYDPKDRDEYELLKKYNLIIEESKD
jgi:cellulose synthase/poly-beta-1,6-N-acetylglucosamine synthase-like glycosyltransferase